MHEPKRTWKVTVFVGSAHKGGAPSRAASLFLENLASYGDVSGEIVVLSDHDIGVCRGSKSCTNRGEERCPLGDDRDLLIEKMTASDGVVFASPNYSFQVSAIMKIYLDRLAFLFHRPRFHGKVFSSIVVPAIGMGGRIVKYLDFVGSGLGFNVVKGSCSRTLEPMSESASNGMRKQLASQSRRFHARLLKPAFPVPSLLGLLMFRMARTGYQLGPIKKAAGALFDRIAACMFHPRAETSRMA